MSKSKFTHEVMQPLRVESGLTQLDLEVYVLKAEVDRLTSGPGGIMEMKQTIADKEAKIERLTKIIKHIDAMNIPGTYFIHAELGNKDHNGMPEKLLVVPSYGCDFSYVYQRTDKTTGPEW